MTKPQKNFFNNPWIQKTVVFGAVLLACVVVTLWVMSSPPAAPEQTREARAQTGMPVTVVHVEPQAYPARITALGEVVPLWQTSLTSQIDGRILSLSGALQEGQVVEEGELLVELDKSPYVMQVAEAHGRLLAAKVELLREEREAREAQRNWRISGLDEPPASPLVMREPQLAAARSDVDAAQASLKLAETLLGYAEITAPFTGVIIRRAVNPGETVFAGDEVTTLYGVDAMEVAIQLDSRQWSQLPEPLIGQPARLHDPDRNISWMAKVVRESRRLEPESRLRTLFLRVEKPLEQEPPLLPGTFVRAEIEGRHVSRLLKLPESALTRQGQVWLVTHESRLLPQHSEPEFFDSGFVYVQAPGRDELLFTVAVAPNTSFAAGLKVQPLTEGMGE